VTAEPDPGAGNERTALAWQRTALSVLAGSAALTKLTADRLGIAATLSVVVGAPLALWVLVESRGRYKHTAGFRRRPRERGGRAAAALAAATGALCLTELLAVLSGR
jgi:uncharacterized membrane protein YidH (DUF202 family)